MLVVLGKEAEGHGCHGVVTPGPVQAAEEVTAFLGKEGAIGVRSPAGARTWHGEPRVPNTNPPHWQVPPRHEGTFLDPPSPPGTGMSLRRWRPGGFWGGSVTGWPSGVLCPPQAGGRWLSHSREHHCIAGLQQEEKPSSLSPPCLDVAGAGSSCSANPAGAFPAGTAEGPGGSAPAVTCPPARVGAEGGRRQLLEGLGSPFPSRGRKARVGHVLQAPLNS